MHGGIPWWLEALLLTIHYWWITMSSVLFLIGVVWFWRRKK